jgi:voltage-gated potassium channel
MELNMQLKKRVYEILDVAKPGDWASKLFDIFMVSLIALNVVSIILETVQSVSTKIPRLFAGFEIFSVIVFSIEYVLRIWSSTENPSYAAPIRGRFRFALRPLIIFDLLAVLPFYLPFLGLDLRFFRSLRLFRLFRIAKLARYSQVLRTFGRVFSAKREELLMIVFLLVLLLILASSLMYFAEHDAQPETFSSIPHAMWWSIITLTTVGYGDVYPITGLGKILAAFIALLGIGMFALPTGILGAAFVEEMKSKKETSKFCPHCGKEIET